MTKLGFTLWAAVLLALVSAVLAQDASTLGRAFYVRADRGSHFIWKRRADLPEKRSDFGIAQDPKRGVVYLVGGCIEDAAPDCPLTTSTLLSYDPNLDQYTYLPPFKYRRYRHNAAVIGDLLIVFGGLNESLVLVGTTEVMNLTSGVWTVMDGGVVGGLSDFTSFVMNNNLYVVGGYTGDFTPQSAMYSYGLADNSWTKVLDMNIPRGDLASAVILNKAYIIGGWTTPDNWVTSIPVNWTEEFDPIANTMMMHTGDRLDPGRGDAAFCAIRGRMFILGGENPSLNPLDDVEVLALDNNSPESSDWHYAGELPDERFRFGCAPLRTNSLHVFGGQTFIAVDGNVTKLATTLEVYEFIEQRIFEDIESRLETPMFISGSATAQHALTTVAEVVTAMSRTPVRIPYRVIETNQAQSEFLGINTSFVPPDQAYIADAPLPHDLYNFVLGTGHVTLQIPLALSPILIMHSIKGSGSQGVQLDACGIAKIFSGNQYKWKDVAIGGVDSSFQNVIVVPQRLPDSSSLTSLMISYLTRACPDSFSLAGFLSIPVQAVPVMFSNNATVTYATASIIVPGLKYSAAAIKNPAGAVLTANNAQLDVSLPPSFKNVTVDLSGYDFLLSSDAAAYPLIAPMFAYVRRDQTYNAQTGQLLKAYLAYLLSPQGQNILASFGHGKLNQYWIGVALGGLNVMRVAPDSLEYIFDVSNPEPTYSLQTSRENRLAYDQALLAATQAQVDLMSTKSSSSILSGIDSDTATGIAIAGLVIAIFAFLLACYAACKLRNLSRADAMNPAGIERRNTAGSAQGIGSVGGVSKYAQHDSDQIQVV